MTTKPDLLTALNRIFINIVHQVFGKYGELTCVFFANKSFEQLYMARLVARDGKIQLLRESLNKVVTPTTFSHPYSIDKIY